MKLILFLCLIGFCLAYEDKTIYQYLKDNGYNALVSAIDKAGMRTLYEGSGPYTVFAPTDNAFIKAGLVSLDILTTEQLRATVQYTTVPEFVLVPMIAQSTIKNTLANQTLTLDRFLTRLRLNGISMVNSTYNDILVSNGVIQPVDTLLTPPVWPARPPPTSPPQYNIYQLILRDDTRFTDLALALLLADLTQVLETGSYTLFAPTNAAFGQYKDNLLDPADPSAKRIYQEVLKYHVVSGRVFSTDLVNGSKLTTLHGTTVSVTVGSSVVINNATVIEADLLATNGVVHVIDHLLIPQDINQVAQG